ncbi:hypothetical protein A4H97_17345 [Niastella yeongjuensis]|uniref:Uncharacterized protein n=1 Tax=Niastella yeongjuensis TaxID=354355 RepID=A0A1V9E1K8_9BACT|nr:hypothetical protein [Niastella yeongjuensis]OQP39982.1 hypothetical protein A4H97_17345 [Niastella yeongjuensis]SEO12493.1 hypothetical protein SAMN05660816_02214 [Niastella yeongjuensis]
MRVKSIWLIIALIVSVSFKNREKGADSVYAMAIMQHMEKFPTETLYVWKCDDIELPSKLGQHKIINIENFDAVMKGRKSLSVLKLFPIELNKGNFDVGIIDYQVEKKSTGINLLNGGSEVFTFSYNADQDKYQIIDRKKFSM